MSTISHDRQPASRNHTKTRPFEDTQRVKATSHSPTIDPLVPPPRCPLGLATQMLVILIGFILGFEPRVLTQQVHFGTTPAWRGFLFALPLRAAAFTAGLLAKLGDGMEAAADSQ